MRFELTIAAVARTVVVVAVRTIFGAESFATVMRPHLWRQMLLGWLADPRNAVPGAVALGGCGAVDGLGARGRFLDLKPVVACCPVVPVQGVAWRKPVSA